MTSVKVKNIYLAYLNGQKTTAKKIGHRWLVGGDFVQPGDKVQIAAIYKDRVWGGSRWAWHTLKGCFLIFDDFMTDEEANEQAELNKNSEVA